MDVLMHYGVKGMKWGTRKKPQIKITENKKSVKFVGGGGGGGIAEDLDGRSVEEIIEKLGESYDSLSSGAKDTINKCKGKVSNFIARNGSLSLEKVNGIASSAKSKVSKFLKKTETKGISSRTTVTPLETTGRIESASSSTKKSSNQAPSGLKEAMQQTGSSKSMSSGKLTKSKGLTSKTTVTPVMTTGRVESKRKKKKK